MSKFKLYNLVLGWITFLIATVVYTLTLEPTVSFWDCGEFISAAYKQQIMHPPGAPFFGMVVRMFTLFSFGDVTNVAWLANFSSALCSSFTILFLFWTISHLARKIYNISTDNLNTGQLISIMGASVVGALAYTFSDTFWFSAVETEVYAMSSLFTAIVFWAILKWENIADKPGADRWLVLISLLIGLSIGVHLLGLLAVPAIAYVYYFKKFEPTRKGFIYTGLIAVGILGVFNSLTPTLVSISAIFDRFFVNSLGMFFGAGMIVFIIAFGIGLAYAIRWSIRKERVLLNTALLCIMAAVIGSTSYTLTIIRSNANPAIDMNDPENAYNLLSYINREQYGENKLVSGGHFAVTNRDWTTKATNTTIYKRQGDEYVDLGKKVTREYNDNVKMLFPRIYSHDKPSHVSFYRSWLNIPEGQTPTMSDNIKFFWTYQMNFMYWRYFMWNFAGRQNNIQGQGFDNTEGNWISGIKFLDESRLGNQDSLPISITENRAYNRYYFLPLILGLFGLFFHFKRQRQDGWVVFLLFFFTGIAIVIYLNQYPIQPRERDYAYVGSFYAFCIWLGFGVMAISEFLKKYMNLAVAASVATVLSLSVPVLMASENWDDHDRSEKYTARDIAKNYLNSCEPNAVLFTLGDNDTYPLWYVQEVEGYRRDVRVVNLSLLGTSWYVDNMRRSYYDDQLPVPFTIDPIKYFEGTRDYMPFGQLQTGGEDYLDLDKVLNFVISDDRRTKGGPSGQYDLFPTKKVKIAVDKNQVLRTGTVDSSMANRIVDEMKWDLKGNGVLKDDLMILDLITNNNWERPIYFATTIGRVGSPEFNGLDKYFHQTGLTYRVLPIENSKFEQRDADMMVDKMYDLMINQYVWGNVEKDINIDPETSRMIENLRGHFLSLAIEYFQTNDYEKAKKCLDTSLEKITNKNFPYTDVIRIYSDLYYRMGEPEKANDLLRTLAANTDNYIQYYQSLKGDFARETARNLQNSMNMYRSYIQTARQNNQAELADELSLRLKDVEDPNLQLQ